MPLLRNIEHIYLQELAEGFTDISKCFFLEVALLAAAGAVLLVEGLHDDIFHFLVLVTEGYDVVQSDIDGVLFNVHN